MNASAAPARIAVTPGEPAGIGPDLVIQLAQQARASELVVIADPELLQQRAAQLGLPLQIKAYDAARPATTGAAGELLVCAHKLAEPCTPGRLNRANSAYVLATITRGTQGCIEGEFAALLTAPVQKNVIAEAGFRFSGHTEFLAELCNAELPVMLLCADTLRVALLTTHLALADIPAQITRARIAATCRIIDRDFRRLLGIAAPRIAVLGLNPHAGEAGQLGREEIEIIEPALRELRAAGIDVRGPLPADSAFTPAALAQCDVVLAMYHDQGLPVLKHAGFGHAVNITLGLPIIRTSVDHGTALELAGTGRAQAGSLQTALQYAEAMAARARA
jgi:4-hydroxythreonine-4-phosphate dehydrogenase